MLLRPYLTEKTLNPTKTGRYTFIVELKANKHQIKENIETLYKVNVVSVTTSTSKRLSQRSGRSGRYVVTKPYKKATVQLKDKQTLPIFKTK